MRPQREVGVGAAIQVWAQRDPSGAQLAAERVGAETPSVRPVVRQALVIGWAHSPRGQEGLAGFLAARPPLHTRVELVETATRELARGGGAEAALGWAEPILRDEGYEPLFKLSVFKAAAGSAAQLDPERTAAWTLEHSGADYAKEGMGIVAKHWGRHDGAAAMAWLGEQPAGELRDQAVREAFGQWTRADPRGTRVWLAAEDSTGLRDPAVEYKVQRTVALEPVRALSWCERIQDTDRQQSCLESTANSWYARDAEAAETWLQQSSLDEEARSRVRKIPTQKEQQRPKHNKKQRRRPRAGGAPG
jgi:hypothetical protein